MDMIIAFVFGFILGGFVGMIVCALAVAAGKNRGDDD